jgi:hypothetical protein
MSTDQPTLAEDWSERARDAQRRRATIGGARYSKPTGRVEAPHSGPERECLNCGAEHSAEIARVIGDDDGNTPVCGECHDNRQHTVQAVVDYLGGGQLVR